MEPNNLLLEMLQKQYELELKFRQIEANNGFWPEMVGPLSFPVDIQSPQAQLFIKDSISRMTEELFEAANELKGRPWKQNPPMVDVEAFYEEIGDWWHFVLRFLLVIFGEPELALEGIVYQYYRKAKINKQRQDGGV